MNVKFLLCSVALSLLLTLPVRAADSAAVDSAAVDSERRVATALPVLQLLSRTLLAGTGIDSVYLPPKRLPVGRIASWLQHSSERRTRAEGPFGALVTVESIWPDHALYTRLRAGNVRVVPVDAAEELIAGGARLRLAADDLAEQRYFWLDPDNLRVMGQIMARDFVRLWPAQETRLRDNLQRLEQAIQRQRLALDQLLMDAAIDSLCVDSPTLLPLARATLLPLEQGDGCGPQALRLVEQRRNSLPRPGYWAVQPLAKPYPDSLADWLEFNRRQLARALDQA